MEPDQTNLRAYQAAELEILLEFQRVCKQLGLRYYLTAGTLLGAVRHKGFIPWDDDIDVAMPREDFDRFANHANTALAPEYLFQDSRTEPLYPYYFAKLRKRGTQVKEPILQSIDMEQGIYIDIFPLDVCPDHNWRALLLFKGMELLTCAILSRVSREFTCGYQKRCVRLAWAILRKLPTKLLFWGREALRRLSAVGTSGRRLCTVGGHHGFPRETYAAEWFQSTVELEFEGHCFPSPAGWAELLRSMYGNYMTPPPEQERQGHFEKE